MQTVSSELSEADVKLALAHHPPNWFVEVEDKWLGPKLTENFDFFLHGHEHREWVVPVGDHHITLSAGACYQRSDKYNGYNLVRLDLESKVCEIWLRRYSDQGGGGWIPNVIPGKKTDADGVWGVENLRCLRNIDRSVGEKKPAEPGKPGEAQRPSEPPAAPGPEDPVEKNLRDDYLYRVMSDVGYLSLAGIDRRSAADDPFMRYELDAVYTALTTRSADPERSMAKRLARPDKETMTGAVAMLDRCQRLVLLGEPGSGKSMFVNFAAWCMAGQLLGHPCANIGLLVNPLPAKGKEDEKPQPWSQGPLIPVRVVLRDFVAKGMPSEDEKASAGHLWRFIASWLSGRGLGDYADRLKHRLKQDGGLVLLDGLDEVPEAGRRRERIRETVDLLLDWWERAKWSTAANGAHKMEEPSLAEYLKTDRGAIRKLLDRLAFQAHADQPDLAGTADISQADLVSGLVEISNNPDVQPLLLIEYLSQRAGILAKRAEGVFTFPHRTFQEYLAACYLAEDDFPEKIVELFKNDPERWREAVLLAGARHAFSGPLGVWALAEQLCCDQCVPDASLDCVWGVHLAGKLLVESADLSKVAKRDQIKLELIREWTLHIATGDRLPALERAAAGVTLSHLGDSRKEITTLDHMQFCLVPAGDFVMSEKDDGKHICTHLD